MNFTRQQIQGLRRPQPSPTEEIAQHYSACLDSARLISSIVTKTSITQQDVEIANMNIFHLRLMRNKPFWTTEDMTPIDIAINTIITANV